MYNVLEKLRSGEPLTAKERVIHEHGLVSVLRQLHDDLDAAVLDAYGWSDLLPLLRVAHGNDTPAEGQTRDDAKRAFDEAILERLVALNAERAAEEARGQIRWLRPDFQNPQAHAAPQQDEIDTRHRQRGRRHANRIAPMAATKPIAWPKTPWNKSAPSPTCWPPAPCRSHSMRSPHALLHAAHGRSACRSWWRCWWRWGGQRCEQTGAFQARDNHFDRCLDGWTAKRFIAVS